tara:strand:+ start:118 stop:324 length:207 start_codon:yes stop_codon:yes gene_type:complete
MSNEKLGAPRAPFFMATPAMKQVEKDGLLLWEVSYSGMVRYFRFDWQARHHFESCIRLHRARNGGNNG